MNIKWSIEDDEEADVYVKSPDGHRFYFGNMEGTSPCCFANAQFIVDACNEYSKEHDVVVKDVKILPNL